MAAIIKGTFAAPGYFAMRKGRKVKILAPVTSPEAARAVVSAGADEIYCGVKVPNVGYVGLSTRLEPCSLSTYDQLKKVVSYARDKGVRTLATTEFPFLSRLIEDKLRKHIRSCVDCGIDALIATDIGIVLMARRMDPGIPIYASTYMASMNSESINFLREHGIERVILERHVTIDEIREIVRECKGIETEIFIHGPGCSNINVSCYGCPNLNLIHGTIETSESSATSLCKTPYEVYDAHSCEKITNTEMLDAYTWCSICRLPELVETGVSGFKVVGREAGREYQEDVTKIYRGLLDLIQEGDMDAFRRGAEEARRNRFVAGGCRKRRCYYGPLFHAPYKLP